MRPGRSAFAGRVVVCVQIGMLVAACYSGTPPQGAPCDPLAPVCPDGQSCVLRAGAHVCLGSSGDGADGGSDSGSGSGSDGALDVDSDGDGFLDSADNCPQRANVDQRNEDGDTVGDACDPCPPFTNNSDGDGDEVGDACDPNPTIPGDQIVLFEGFAGNVPTGWIATGTWSTNNGALISTANAGDTNTLVVPVMTSARQTLYSRVTITAQTATTGGGIGIVDRFDGTAGVVCGGARSALSGASVLALMTAGGMFIQTTPHPFMIGTEYSLVLERTDGSYDCTDTATAQTVSAAAMAAGMNIGLRNRIASGSFAFLLVVRSP